MLLCECRSGECNSNKYHNVHVENCSAKCCSDKYHSLECHSHVFCFAKCHFTKYFSNEHIFTKCILLNYNCVECHSVEYHSVDSPSAECHSAVHNSAAEFCSVKCRSTECHFTKCHSSKCQGAIWAASPKKMPLEIDYERNGNENVFEKKIYNFVFFEINLKYYSIFLTIKHASLVWSRK